MGDDGERVTGGDESVGAVNHVSVTISVRSSSKGNVVLVDDFDQGVSVCQIRIGMAAIEIRAGYAVLRGSREPELLVEDGLPVWPSHTVESVKEDLEVWVGAEELLDDVEVEDFLEHNNIVGSAVDDLDFEGAVGIGANGGNVNVGDGSKLVRSDSLGRLIDLVRHGFGGRATIGQVVLDTKIVLGACRITRMGQLVTCCAQQCAIWVRVRRFISYRLGCGWR